MSARSSFFIRVVFLNLFFIFPFAHQAVIPNLTLRSIEIVLSRLGSNNRIWLHGVLLRSEQLVRQLASSNSSSSEVNHEVFQQPDLIIWDPLVTGLLESLWCPNCIDNGQNEVLKLTRWKDGKTACDQPRRLYGLSNDALLVSCVYVCCKGHQIIAHDPFVIGQLRNSAMVPFILFHKAGITKELQHFITTHANVGMTLSDIQTLWLQTRFDAHGEHKRVYLTEHGQNAESALPSLEWKQPGEKIIACLIAFEYYRKENLYTERMCQMKADKWLSCDHTFKVSSNIGFWFNKRWVKLYDTLFIVLNEEGIVLSWKLCKGTKFSSIKNVLTQLKTRLDSYVNKPRLFLIDNCCSWRSKLNEIFPEIEIKLDIFHALQRVIQKIPRKKGCTEALKLLRKQLIQSLKNSVRDSADIGKERSMVTPSPDIMMKNINNFLTQWGGVKVDSVELLPSAAIKEIEKLKRHIEKGCLSQIPPSAGTNKNEALHRTLNKSLKRSRIGLELAIAFLGLFFYRWNEKKLANKKKKGKVSFVYPVETYMRNDMTDNALEHFGGFLVGTEKIEASSCEFSEDLDDPNEVIGCINSLLSEQNDAYSSDDSEINLTPAESDHGSEEDEDSNILSNIGIAHAIEQASNLSFFAKMLGDFKCEIPISRNATNLLHLKNSLSLLSTLQSCENDSSNLKNLDDLLLLNNMERIPVAGNGNCFFVSLATMIQYQLVNGTLSNEAQAQIESQGINLTSDNIQEIATLLCTVIVNEWLTHVAEYQPYLISGGNYQAEAEAFLREGHFAAELGNTMPLAASNALQIPIVVLTAMANFPVIPICPRDRILNDTPIFLAYDMNFAGHYDAVKKSDKPANKAQEESGISQGDKQPTVSCRCGKGAKRKMKDFISCHEFKSGCKCFQNVVGCSIYCQCLNRTNPRGKRNPEGKPITCVSRKRRHHENITNRLPGKVYTELKAGGTTNVQWTLFEELVLMHIMLALFARDSLEPETLCSEYNHVVVSVDSSNIRNCLGKKTFRQVSQKLAVFLNRQHVLETSTREQARLNYN